MQCSPVWERRKQNRPHRVGDFVFFGVPSEIRTRVTAVKGRCPRPLDDGDNIVELQCWKLCGGDKQDRTADLLHAMQALSQLSYTPTWKDGNYSRKTALLQSLENRLFPALLGFASDAAIKYECGPALRHGRGLPATRQRPAFGFVPSTVPARASSTAGV